MDRFDDVRGLFDRAVQDGASDLFLIAGAKPSARVDGRLRHYGDMLMPADTDRLVRGLYSISGRDMAVFESDGDDDFSFALQGRARFRVNAFRQRGSVAMVARIVPFGIPDPGAIGLSGEVLEFADLPDGLVLVTGTAGSGKSTTLACMIDRINHTRDAHVVTLEDPIEYLYKNDMAIVSQREIGLDTASYASGLRACLREAPDVILLGEMRDCETAQTAMSAAETGHLVLATLHTKGAANSIDRLVDLFPPAAQDQVRAQLAMTVRGVLFQELLPKAVSGRVPAFEIMRFTPGVRSLVREGRTHQLDAAMADGQSDGMRTMARSVEALRDAGVIDGAVASRYLGQDGTVQAQARSGRRHW